MEKEKTQSTIAGLIGTKLKGFKVFADFSRWAHHPSRTFFNSYNKDSYFFKAIQVVRILARANVKHSDLSPYQELTLKLKVNEKPK